MPYGRVPLTFEELLIDLERQPKEELRFHLDEGLTLLERNMREGIGPKGRTAAAGDVCVAELLYLARGPDAATKLEERIDQAIRAVTARPGYKVSPEHRDEITRWRTEEAARIQALLNPA